MIASILNAIISLAIPLINLFIKDYQKRRDLKEQMFRIAEKHSEKVLQNLKIRKDLEYLKETIKHGTPKKETKDE